jgi:hypothetical protein
MSLPTPSTPLDQRDPIVYRHGHGSTAHEHGGVRAVADALMAAGATGMRCLSVVLESEAESGAKVTFELAAALGSAVAAHAKLYTWPYDLCPETR